MTEEILKELKEKIFEILTLADCNPLSKTMANYIAKAVLEDHNKIVDGLKKDIKDMNKLCDGVTRDYGKLEKRLQAKDKEIEKLKQDLKDCVGTCSAQMKQMIKDKKQISDLNKQWQRKAEALEKIVDKKIGKNTDERLTQFYFVVKDAIDKILKEGK